MDRCIKEQNLKKFTKATEAKNILKMFTHFRKSWVYDESWARITVIFLTAFTEQETYCFLTLVLKFAYPDKYFSAEGYFLSKNSELCVLGSFLKEKAPSISTNLTAKKKKPNSEDFVNDESGYVAFYKALGNHFFNNLFSKNLDSESFLKLCDVLLVEGFGFIHQFPLIVTLDLL